MVVPEDLTPSSLTRRPAGECQGRSEVGNARPAYRLSIDVWRGALTNGPGPSDHHRPPVSASAHFVGFNV